MEQYNYFTNESKTEHNQDEFLEKPILPVILAISGYRGFEDYDFIHDKIKKYHEDYNIAEIIVGDCRGTDKLAVQIAKDLCIQCTIYPANWLKYGLKAGPLRNMQLYENSTHGMAFLSDLSKGTLHFVNTFLKNDKPITIYRTEK